MIEIIGLLILSPLFLLSDWFVFLKGLPDLHAELTRASHGVVMMLVAGGAIYYLQDGYIRQFPLEYRTLVYAAFGFIGIWGAYWLMLGAARSRQRRDYRYLGRACVKVCFGVGLYYGVPHYWHTVNVWELLVFMASQAVAAFCVVTGLTKIALLMRPLPRLMTGDGISAMPHGDAGFSGGLDG
jgi:hypothetical protein